MEEKNKKTPASETEYNEKKSTKKKPANAKGATEKPKKDEKAAPAASAEPVAPVKNETVETAKTVETVTSVESAAPVEQTAPAVPAKKPVIEVVEIPTEKKETVEKKKSEKVVAEKAESQITKKPAKTTEKASSKSSSKNADKAEEAEKKPALARRKSAEKKGEKVEGEKVKSTMKHAKSKKPRSQSYALPLGIVVIIFSVIGIIFTIYSAVTGFIGLLDNSAAEKEKYQKMLVPVVMNGIDEFDDVTKADMSQLIEASVWSIIKSDVNTDQYEMDGDELLFPAADVEKAFISLFGTDVKIKHMTVYTAAFEFEYDSEKQAYKVPITGVEPTYTPRVLDVDSKSNTVILTVAYISGSEWTQGPNGDLVPPTPSKYVKVTLRKKDKAYYISAIQATDAPETK